MDIKTTGLKVIEKQDIHTSSFLIIKWPVSPDVEPMGSTFYLGKIFNPYLIMKKHSNKSRIWNIL